MSNGQTHGAPAGPAGQPSGHTGSDFFTWIRSFGTTRGPDRWAGGVACGLAHRWGVDPILVRGLFVVASIFLGVGLLVYGILWLLLPEPDGRIHVEEALRGRWTAGMTGGLVASILGLGGARTGLVFESGANGPLWGAIWAVFWLAVAALIVGSIVRSRQLHRGRAGVAGVPGAGPATGQAAPGPAPGQQAPGGAYAASAASGPPSAPRPGQVPYPEAPVTGGSVGDPSFGRGPAGTPYGASASAREYRRGPGGPFTTVVVGVAVIVAGTLLAFQLAGKAIVDPASGAIWAVAAAVIGLGIIVAGLRGRSAGILSFFAVVALAGAALTQPVYQLSRPQGSVDMSPTTISEAQSGYSITGASGQLDLRGLDSAGPLASEAVVPVESTVSQVKITVPKNVPVRVDADGTLSNIHFGSKSIAGITAKDSETYNADRPGATLVVNVHATLSNIEIQQEQ
ncbi:hypothetical protein SCMU_30390 [Sinomonas cyclohexanicum]|uniref:Phage shock protein PspC N-terminal domain-containing protein n=1 Tax=Sinomonas cyclohexanicum TaxID=322009 RepID=A0ABM7PYH4_SINCY|nr:PspC domain-containing protein [Corynebacterium cyclohexanicum]BCT77197.1 hypothetical protein SCMU_30390 [Corynebacterium cyclohexanicum]